MAHPAIKKFDVHKPYEKPKTQSALLREMIITQRFVYLIKDKRIYDGVIIEVATTEVAIVQMWPCDKEEERLTYYLNFTILGDFDMETRTGFIFGDLPDDQ